METESQSCSVCSLPYDNKDHTPRVLINCGHTLCSSCLTEIIKNPNLRKCPLDNSFFKKSHKSLDHFPVNFALLELLERKNKNICKIHGEELKMFCLKDKMKICSDCAFFGDHKEHSTKWIKELKNQGAKLKKDLEESLMRFKVSQFENNQDTESLMKGFFSKMGDKFEEIIQILRSKELEWKKHVEHLFRGTIDSNIGSLIKVEAEKVLEEIDQACQKEENLAILDQDFGSVISRLQPEDVKDKLSKLSDETSKVMDCIESFLTDQAKPIQSFDLLNEKAKLEKSVIREEEQPIIKQEGLSSETLIKYKQKPTLLNSLINFLINEDHLKICFNLVNSREQKIDLEPLNKMKKIRVEFEKYETLFQEDSNDLTALSEVLRQLDNYNFLMVIFLPSGLTDDYAVKLFKFLFCRIEHLAILVILFERCEITNETILFFCTYILTKAISLRFLTLKLSSTRITDKSLFALAKSLYPLSKNLKSLRLKVEDTEITDEGIEKIFNVIERVIELELYLTGTQITDHSLKVLGNNLMPSLKNLEKFTLIANKTKISMEGVSAIFTGVPQNISVLVLVFKGIILPDTVISLFEEKVCPKLKLVENVFVTLEGADLQGKMSKILKTIRIEAAKKKKGL